MNEPVWQKFQRTHGDFEQSSRCQPKRKPLSALFHATHEEVYGEPFATSLIEKNRPEKGSPCVAYRLGTGDYVELIHTVEADGTLELDASRQSGDTLSRLDRYCATSGGR